MGSKYETQREQFSLLTHDSSPTAEFFLAPHINTAFLPLHLQQVPAFLNELAQICMICSNFLCVIKACGSDVCGEAKGSISP